AEGAGAIGAGDDPRRSVGGVDEDVGHRPAGMAQPLAANIDGRPFVGPGHVVESHGRTPSARWRTLPTQRSRVPCRMTRVSRKIAAAEFFFGASAVAKPQAAAAPTPFQLTPLCDSGYK